MVDGDEAVGGQASGAQEIARATHHREVAHGVGLANLAQDGDGALVVTLGDVGREDVEERVAYFAVQLPQALSHADLLRGVGGALRDGVFEGGGGAERVGIGPRHVGRQAIDRVEVVLVVHGGVVDGVVKVEGEGAGPAQSGGPLPARTICINAIS
ncbi:hypothetical protein GOP47_0022293 [Adiantum capillus-veneris]|uniref:Uncharacterized protein n=1 Tax=Adiantum capillus-veneris TaxID=13818 RepID=A0A9D4Z8N6_ADICA|nr:hypothetical protein GOP47_0022293 [Adiantum capillus-veneris]